MAAFQRRRDEYTRPMFDLLAFTSKMDKVVSSGVDLGTPLFRAIARQPEEATRYIGMFNGATPVRSFINPLNLARIVMRDQIRNELPHQIDQVSRRLRGTA